MSEAYETLIEESIGHRYYIQWMYDRDHRTPWEDGEDSDLVRTVHCREDKRPGEHIIHQDRGYYHLFDYQAAVRKARKEGWGCINPATGDYNWPTKGQRAVAAVDKLVDHYQGWLNDDWWYVGISVTLAVPNINMDGEEEWPDFDELDDDNFLTFESSCWGIESCSDEEHFAEIISDLKHDCMAAWHESNVRRSEGTDMVTIAS